MPSRTSTAPIASLAAGAGLLGGFAAARYTKRRELGGALFVLAGAISGREWLRRSGPAAAAGLLGLYTAAMGGSHPLAKKIGPWPSVLAVTAATVAASETVARSAG